MYYIYVYNQYMYHIYVYILYTLGDEVGRINEKQITEELTNQFYDNAFNYSNDSNDQHIDDEVYDINISKNECIY